MKLRKLNKNNDNGSIYPVAVFIIILAVASLMLLIINYVVEPFMNLMASDFGTSASVSAPRLALSQLIVPVWTKGLLIVIMLGSGLGLLMEYQKMKYQMG